MSLPPEWLVKKSKSHRGHLFYYNKLTKETRWEKPNVTTDEEFPELATGSSTATDETKRSAPVAQADLSRNSKRRKVEKTAKLSDINKFLRGSALFEGKGKEVKTAAASGRDSVTNIGPSVKGKLPASGGASKRIFSEQQPSKPSGSTQKKHSCSRNGISEHQPSNSSAQTHKRPTPSSKRSDGSKQGLWTPLAAVEDRKQSGKGAVTAGSRSSPAVIIIKQPVITRGKSTIQEIKQVPNKVKLDTPKAKLSTPKGSGKEKTSLSKQPSRSTPYPAKKPQSSKPTPIPGTPSLPGFKIPRRDQATPRPPLKTTPQTQQASSHQAKPGSTHQTTPKFSHHSTSHRPRNDISQSERNVPSSSSTEPGSLKNVETDDLDTSVPMDVDSILGSEHGTTAATEQHPTRSQQQLSNGSNTIHSPGDRIYFVLDTNVFIHSLDFVEQLIAEHQTGGTVVVVPWMVLQELDGLKSGGKVSVEARAAINTLLDYRRSQDGGLVFEGRTDEYTECPDDRILSTLDMAWLPDYDISNPVVFVSEDKNLRLKADVTGYHCKTVIELLSLPEDDGNANNIGSRLLNSDAFQRPRRPQTIARPPRDQGTPPRRPSPGQTTPRPPHQTTPRPPRRPGSTPQNANLMLSSTPTPSQQPSPASGYTSFNINTATPTTAAFNSTSYFEFVRHAPKAATTAAGVPGLTELKKRGRKLSMGQTLARFTGSETMVIDSNRDRVERHDKTILQVLDEMSGSMNVFRQQIVTFVEAKLSEPGMGNAAELAELQNFLSALEPDMQQFIEACKEIEGVPGDSLKKHFGILGSLATAIQSYTVHHLRFAPNLSASDIYTWMSDGAVGEERRRQVTDTRAHFELMKGQIEQAVNCLLTQRVFVQ